MYAAVSQFESAAALLPDIADPPNMLERAEGAIRIGFNRRHGRNQLVEAFQQGSLKVRFPRQFDTDVPEAVVINTAGGITGGDRLTIKAMVCEDAALTLTSQAAEKVYRSAGGEGRVDVTLLLEAGARLGWLPHETIMFDAGRIRRNLTVDMAEDAELVLCEAIVLGRISRGETIREGYLSDRWRVRRGGKLIYADNLKLAWDAPEATGGAATLGGGRTFASFLVVSPSAESMIDRARDALVDRPKQATIATGASAWNGMLAARLVASNGAALRESIIHVCNALGVRMPHAWSI